MCKPFLHVSRDFVKPWNFRLCHEVLLYRFQTIMTKAFFANKLIIMLVSVAADHGHAYYGYGYARVAAMEGHP